MSGNVVLSASLRDTILNFNKAQRSIDATSLRIATGKRVNSALESPQNFFAAQSLTSTALDLIRVTNGISQNIFAIRQADNGIASLQQLLQQAETITLDAIEILQNAEPIATITADAPLSEFEGYFEQTGIDDVTFDLVVRDADGETRRASILFSAGEDGNTLISRINAAADSSGNSLNLEARTTDEGYLQIRSFISDLIRIESSAGTADIDFITAIGLRHVSDQNANITGSAAREIRSQKLYRIADGELAQGSDRIRDVANTPLIVGEDGHQFAGIRAQSAAGTDFYFFSINDGPEQTFNFYGDQNIANQSFSFDEFVQRINANTSLNSDIEAEFDTENGQIVIRALHDDVVRIGFRIFEAGGDNLDTAFGFGFGAADATTGNGVTSTPESIVFGNIPPEVTEPQEEDLANVLTSINEIVTGAVYAGKNLIAGDNLITPLNTDGSSKLFSEGKSLTSSSLGLDEQNYDTITTSFTALNTVRNAVQTLRTYSDSLKNDLSTLQSRYDFTIQSAATNDAGADDLTTADLDEEGAKLLAAQTRQEIAYTVMSLVQGFQGNVLGLFEETSEKGALFRTEA